MGAHPASRSVLICSVISVGLTESPVVSKHVSFPNSNQLAKRKCFLWGVQNYYTVIESICYYYTVK